VLRGMTGSFRSFKDIFLKVGRPKFKNRLVS
jgi:hypothetical protein